MTPDHRQEIDGLRALAVGSVIPFHAGLPLFAGGYVGVDVFFVISGYLMARIVLGELATGNFRLASFYARRARRILPALLMVMLVCLPFAWAWMMPDDLKRFSKSLVAGTLMGSNLLFWLESGYFNTVNEFKPLIHTWSLSLEAQYYLLFPLAVLAAWHTCRAWMPTLLAAAGLTSFALALWCNLEPSWQNAGFYLLPTRAWELLLGACVATHWIVTVGVPPVPTGARLVRELPGLAGLALIASAVLADGMLRPLPGAQATLAAAGAALVIACGVQGTITARLLSLRALVGLGLISYSTYLWHQPLFALARIQAYTSPGPLLLAGLVLASLVLGYASWRWVELPWRAPGRVGQTRFWRLAATTAALVVLPGLAGYVLDGLPGRYPAALAHNLNPAHAGEWATCPPAAGAASEGPESLVRRCTFGALDSRYTVALYGDSHAQALSAELALAFKQRGIRGLRLSLPDCGAIPGIVEVNALSHAPPMSDDCVKAFDMLLAQVQQRVDAVIVGVRWTYRLYPVAGEITSLAFDNGEGGAESMSDRRFAAAGPAGQLSFGAEAKALAVAGLVAPLLRTGKRVLLVYPVPEVGWNVPRYNMAWYRRQHEVPLSISTPHRRFEQRHRFVHRVLDGLGQAPNLRRVKPADLLCNTRLPGRCMAQIDQTALYFDDDHLSNAGARLLVPAILAQLQP